MKETGKGSSSSSKGKRSKSGKRSHSYYYLDHDDCEEESSSDYSGKGKGKGKGGSDSSSKGKRGKRSSSSESYTAPGKGKGKGKGIGLPSSPTPSPSRPPTNGQQPSQPSAPNPPSVDSADAASTDVGAPSNPVEASEPSDKPKQTNDPPPYIPQTSTERTDASTDAPIFDSRTRAFVGISVGITLCLIGLLAVVVRQRQQNKRLVAKEMAQRQQTEPSTVADTGINSYDDTSEQHDDSYYQGSLSPDN